MNLRLKTLRQQKNINQAELGKILDVGKTTISNYETGYSVPDLETVVKLADYFNVSTDYLLGRTDYPEMCTEQIFQTTNLLAENEIEVLEILRKVNDRQQIKLIGRIEEIVKQITSEKTNHNNETGDFKSSAAPSTLSKKEVG
ncbi:MULTISPECIES: helix-turn-helix domain-containing protein [unclassified Acetobacterium]|jgi:transcriptional regulator with XRE-family HTH domain|uniref:helix-turn-helix domain-containing protein n=1 Tax=unclassified Acetobacterium TaxID=2638182 RepID=UPI000DBEB61E|nr:MULTISPECIES: helix-turn-helix transcriptional regulator [unclassified Acetobacterium]AWW28351.1 XRE family transcriptional regulator [Acetobacterium sp. KB-1]MDZ5726702.1 helix-turn-helix transcriptional regulator [Acetobacterium sp. K1/6]